MRKRGMKRAEQSFHHWFASSYSNLLGNNRRLLLRKKTESLQIKCPRQYLHSSGGFRRNDPPSMSNMQIQTIKQQSHFDFLTVRTE